MDDVRALVDLVGIPSPSGDEDAACAAFAALSTRAGMRVVRDRAGNVLASVGRGRPHTMVLGHIDTVPGSWPVRLEDGFVSGRGTVDAKGPLVAALLAAARVRGRLAGTCTVVAAVGEETDSRGAFELLRREPPDALLVAEPSGWDRVTVGYRGQRLGRFQAASVPSHASAPHPSALDCAVDAAAAVRGHLARIRAASMFASTSSRFLEWTHARTAREERAGFLVDVRVPRGFDWKALETVAPGIVWGRAVEAVVVPKGNAVTRALVAAIRRTGGAPSYVLKGGTSDMNHAARVWRVPMASYGPGNSEMDHGPDERLSVEEFLRGIQVLEAAIVSLCQ